VECFLHPVWSLLGYALLCQEVIRELVDEWPYEKCYCLENGPSLYYVVYLEGAQ
jgi:hypothetical protein